MSFVGKTAPTDKAVGDTLTIRERGMYGGAAIRSGDTIYLWSSETQGGSGLWARATVLQRLPESGRVAIDVRIDQLRSGARLTVDELAPYRDSYGYDPMIGLSRKLYRHAHNKIAALGDNEGAFLERHFRTS